MPITGTQEARGHSGRPWGSAARVKHVVTEANHRRRTAASVPLISAFVVSSADSMSVVDVCTAPKSLKRRQLRAYRVSLNQKCHSRIYYLVSFLLTVNMGNLIDYSGLTNIPDRCSLSPTTSYCRNKRMLCSTFVTLFWTLKYPTYYS